MFKTNHSGN